MGSKYIPICDICEAEKNPEETLHGEVRTKDHFRHLFDICKNCAGVLRISELFQHFENKQQKLGNPR